MLCGSSGDYGLLKRGAQVALVWHIGENFVKTFFLSVPAQRCVWFVYLSWCEAESLDARHWVQQGHVLGAIERQALVAVVMHHLRDAGEHAAALVQGVAVLFGLGDDNVDAALARPESHGGNDTGDENHSRSGVFCPFSTKSQLWDMFSTSQTMFHNAFDALKTNNYNAFKDYASSILIVF